MDDNSDDAPYFEQLERDRVSTFMEMSGFMDEIAGHVPENLYLQMYNKLKNCKDVTQHLISQHKENEVITQRNLKKQVCQIKAHKKDKLKMKKDIKNLKESVKNITYIMDQKVKDEAIQERRLGKLIWYVSNSIQKEEHRKDFDNMLRKIWEFPIPPNYNGDTLDTDYGENY